MTAFRAEWLQVMNIGFLTGLFWRDPTHNTTMAVSRQDKPLCLIPANSVPLPRATSPTGMPITYEIGFPASSIADEYASTLFTHVACATNYRLAAMSARLRYARIEAGQCTGLATKMLVIAGDLRPLPHEGNSTMVAGNCLPPNEPLCIARMGTKLIT